jgi:hypothetical protein
MLQGAGTTPEGPFGDALRAWISASDGVELEGVYFGDVVSDWRLDASSAPTSQSGAAAEATPSGPASPAGDTQYLYTIGLRPKP